MIVLISYYLARWLLNNDMHGKSCTTVFIAGHIARWPPSNDMQSMQPMHDSIDSSLPCKVASQQQDAIYGNSCMTGLLEWSNHYYLANWLLDNALPCMAAHA